MGLESAVRIERLSRVAAATAACVLAAGCDRLPDLDAPTQVQLVCTPAPTAGTTAATIVTGAMVFVLDTGDGSVRWVNTGGAPAGRLTVKDHQYEFAFVGKPPWSATVNRFDGAMTRDLGPAGPNRVRQTLACKREAEGPRL